MTCPLVFVNEPWELRAPEFLAWRFSVIPVTAWHQGKPVGPFSPVVLGIKPRALCMVSNIYHWATPSGPHVTFALIFFSHSSMFVCWTCQGSFVSCSPSYPSVFFPYQALWYGCAALLWALGPQVSDETDAHISWASSGSAQLFPFWRFYNWIFYTSCVTS